MTTKRCLNIPLSIMLCVPFLLLITTAAAENHVTTRALLSRRQHMGLAVTAHGIPGIPGNPEPAGPAGAAGSPGNHGPEGPMGPRGNKGDEGPSGRRGSSGTKGAQGSPGPPGPAGNKGKAGARGNQGPPGSKGPQGSSGPPGSRGNKGDTGARGIQGPIVLRGSSLWYFLRNWTRCVFKNLTDDRGSGLLFKECVFKKMSDNTGLRVFWVGKLHLQYCYFCCCRRWYFTFNGAECSAPAAIDGVVYLVLQKEEKKGSARKHSVRFRQIEGVCEKVHKGTVRVGFWVGNCAGCGSAKQDLDGSHWKSAMSQIAIYVQEVPPPQA